MVAAPYTLGDIMPAGPATATGPDILRNLYRYVTDPENARAAYTQAYGTPSVLFAMPPESAVATRIETWNVDPDPTTPETAPGATLQPPPPRPPTATPSDAEPFPDGPTEAEQDALRALPLDARRKLCLCRGPGWTIHASGVAVPRLRAPSPDVVGVAIVGWLPANNTAILDAAVDAWAGKRVSVEWDAGTRKEPSGRVYHHAQILSEGWVRHVSTGPTMCVAALCLLAHAERNS